MPAGARITWLRSCLIVSALAFAGCGKTNPTDSTAGDAAADPSSASDQGASSAGATDQSRGLKIRPNAKDVLGRWGLVITQPIPDDKGQPVFSDICLVLLEFLKDETAGVKSAVVAVMPEAPEMTVSNATVDQNQLQFQMAWGGREGDFRGELVDGVIRGSLNLPGMGVTPAMLRPTEETSFEGWTFAPPASGLAQFQAAIQSKEQPSAVIDAAKELRGSALSMHAFNGLFSRLNQYPNLDVAQLRDIYTAYLDCAAPWGSRVVDQSKLQAALAATITRRFPELALEWIEALKTVGEPLKSEMTETIQQLSDQAHADIALRDLKGDDAVKQAAAFSELEGLLSNQRYNPEILEALGIYAAGHDQTEAAKGYFADIVVLPMLESMLSEMRSGQPPGDPTPRERLLTIWETEKGSVEGFDEFLEATYQQKIEELAQQTIKASAAVVPEDQRQRTTLVELFTGIGCPPCVAADTALATLAETYPTSSVIVLQYHQHIPAPDPLTNQDSEDRFAYYQGEGTPTAIIDGVMSPETGVSGLLHHVTATYAKMRTLVDARLKMPAGGKLQLAATLEDGTLKVSATGTEFDEQLLPNLRLRLALVDNDIHLRAPNGIREHHNVVREMPGGAKGTGARGGKLEYTLSMPIAEVVEHLEDYLKQFEAGRNLQFTTKPTKLGALSLVGWVQNEATREILQAVIVPVTGSAPAKPTETPAATETPQPADPASATEPGNTPQ